MQILKSSAVILQMVKNFWIQGYIAVQAEQNKYIPYSKNISNGK